MNVPYEKPRILSVTAEHVARLEHENEKLRHDLEEANNQAEEVCIENAKLRELVRILYYCHLPWKDCDKCAMNGVDMRLEASDAAFCDGLHDRMRELGLEVE